MNLRENLTVNNSNLYINSSNTVELAKKYGTPLYVMDEDRIISNCLTFKNAMDKYFNGKCLVLFASKAFCNVYMHKLMASLGLGIDVVSGGELYTAKTAGFDMNKVYFHGNNKTLSELKMALELNVGRIVIDNVEEMGMLNSAAAQMNKTVKVMFRLKPGVEAHTHDFVKTGQLDSKFGFAIENGEAYNAISHINDYKNLEYYGIHCHIGSQIFDPAPFEQAAFVMLEFIKTLKNECALITKELNLGGGYGIVYTDEDDPASYELFCSNTFKAISNYCSKENIEIPFVLIEPGRSIAGSAGITLYTVGSVKRIKGVRNYVSIDGGMADNPRYILYGAKYDVIVANKANDDKNEIFTLVGKCCESGDIISENIKLQTPAAGDIIAVLGTGAYNYSMSSNYNRIPKPAIVAVSGNSEKVIVKRETYDDIIRNDLL